MKRPLGYLIPEFPGQTHVFFWREIQALRRMGEDIRIVSTRKPHPIVCRHDFADRAVQETRYAFPPPVSSVLLWAATGCRGLAAGREYLAGLEPVDFKGRMRRRGLLVTAAALARWCARENVAHLHGHSCGDAAHLLALCRRLGGPPFSLTLHGDLAIYGADQRSKMAQAAFVHAAGTHLRKQLMEQVGLPAERVRVTCMGVDTEALSSRGKDRAFATGALHLAMVARLHSSKGHEHVLAAMKRAIEAGLDLRCTMAGEGPDREAIAARIRALGLDDRVTLPGTLSESEVADLLSRADAYVLASVGMGDAWPVSLMEAMACGLPVISTVVGATPEIVTHGEDGLLVPQADADALAEAMIRLARDVDARRALGERARLTARKRFDVGVTAGALRDAIYAGLEGLPA